MSRLVAFLLSPILSVMSISPVPVVAQESEEACDPVGLLVSGLEVEDGAELLLCANQTLTTQEDTTVTAVCFSSNSIEEVEVSAGGVINVSSLCYEHDVVQCGDGICFAPRGEVSPIEIIVSDGPSVTLLDWNDVPGSDRYIIQVFEGSEPVFTSQEAVSEAEADGLVWDSEQTISVTAIAPNSAIIGYGSFLVGEDDEWRPVSRVLE